MSGAPPAALRGVRPCRTSSSLLICLGVLMLLVALVAPPTRLFVHANSGAGAGQAPSSAAPRTLGALPLGFEANAGQGPAGAQFLASAKGYSLALSPTTMGLSLEASKGGLPTQVRMHIMGGNADAAGTGEDASAARTNYLIGKDPTQWHLNIATFQKVAYHDVYAGIDVVYHSNQGQLEYDFIVAPGADPTLIRLGFDGAQSVSVNSAGALVIATTAGPLRFKAPHLYQDMKGARHAIRGQFVSGSQGVAFAIGSYDHARPLVIDPAVAYSTYIGGSGDDAGGAISFDGAGNEYIAGRTASPDWPATTGAFETSNPSGAAGTNVGQVSKFTPTGALVYSTYLGGDIGSTNAAGIGVDSAGDAVVDGGTTATDFPTTSGAYQTAPVGSTAVFFGFVTKLNAAGSGLLYSTYIGDGIQPAADIGALVGLALDASSNIYFVGSTCAADFPTTAGAFQTASRGCNVVVAKFSAPGALVYSTYVGGSGGDNGRSIAVDGAGNAYVEGITASTDFPVTPGAFQTTNHGNGDAFVFKLNASGTALLYGTYLGGSGAESSDNGGTGGIAIDASGDAYVTAGSGSTDFPTTSGASQTTLKGSTNAFVTELNPAGNTLVYSTYLGGSGADSGRAIVAGPGGTAYVVGDTSSSDFPMMHPAQAVFGGAQDAFVAQVAAGGSSLVFSTYLGGSGADSANAVALQSATLAVTGYTLSANFPTARAFQATNAGIGDGFVTSYSLIDLLSLSQMASPVVASAGQNVTYTMTVGNDGSDGNATGVTLSDPLPATATYVSATSSQGSCTLSSGTVSCALGAMPANSTATVTIAVTAPNGSTTLVNTAMVSAQQTDPSPSDNVATTTVYVDPTDMSITQTSLPQPAHNGQPLTYTLAVANAGPRDATHVTVVDALPSDVTLVSATTTHGSCTHAGRAVTCSLGTMAPHSSATVVEKTTVHDATGASLINTATVSAHQADANPANNIATTTTPVDAPGCGQVITTSTTLSADIGPCLANGVIIGADHITLNLNGHRIFGRASGRDDIVGIPLPVRLGVTIENGSVDSFAEGIFVNSGAGNTIKNMNVHDNIGPRQGPGLNAPQPDFGDGILIESSSSNQVLSSTINHNGIFDGIAILGLDANFNLIQGNTITNNTSFGASGDGQGIDVNPFLSPGDPRRGDSLYGNRIVSNTISGNESAGTSSISDVHGTFEYNDVEHNGVGPSAVFPENGIGLGDNAVATPNTDMLVDHNKVIGNGADGIQAVFATGNRILNNTTGGNNANGQGFHDLDDLSGNCTSNTWLHNTYSSAGVTPPCLASTNQGPRSATAAPARRPSGVLTSPTLRHTAPLFSGNPVHTDIVSGGELSPNGQHNTATSNSTVSGPGCGSVITSNLVLQADVGPCPGPGLIAGASYISIDLNGHSVIGSAQSASAADAGIELQGVQHVTVKDGTVTQFGVGVFINLGANDRLEHLKVHDNIGPDPDPSGMSGGITVFHSSLTQILNNTVTHNGVNAGIGVFGLDSIGNLIQNNTVTKTSASTSTTNGGYGIEVTALLEPNDPRRGMPIDGNEIRDNTVADNAGAGIVSATNINGDIAGNLVGGNGVSTVSSPRDGIRVTYDSAGGSSPNTLDAVSGNAVTANGDNGIIIVSDGNEISTNTAGGNDLNNDGSFDLNDANPRCGSNTWSGNTWGGAGFNRTCVTKA